MSHGQTLWIALWILYHWTILNGHSTEFTDTWWSIIMTIKGLDPTLKLGQQKFIDVVQHITFDKKNTSNGVRLIFIDHNGKLSIVGNEAFEKLKTLMQYIK